jgi:hypothetical protein
VSAGRGFGADKLVRHVEQVAQNAGRDAGKANQDDGIAEVVVGDIVKFRGSGEQFSAVVKIDADRNRTGFGGAVGGQAGEEISAELERRRTVGSAFLNAGQGEADGFYGIEVEGAFWHGGNDFRRSDHRNIGSSKNCWLRSLAGIGGSGHRIIDSLTH